MIYDLTYEELENLGKWMEKMAPFFVWFMCSISFKFWVWSRVLGLMWLTTLVTTRSSWQEVMHGWVWAAYFKLAERSLLSKVSSGSMVIVRTMLRNSSSCFSVFNTRNMSWCKISRIILPKKKRFDELTKEEIDSLGLYLEITCVPQKSYFLVLSLKHLVQNIWKLIWKFQD